MPSLRVLGREGQGKAGEGKGGRDRPGKGRRREPRWKEKQGETGTLFVWCEMSEEETQKTKALAKHLDVYIPV